MRGTVTATAVAVILSGTAWAQEPAKPPAPAQERHESIRGLDLYVGVLMRYETVSAATETKEAGLNYHYGGDASATYRFARWFGVAVAAGSEPFLDDNVSATYVVGGPRFSTRFGDWGVRGFAHVLGGFAHTGSTAPAQNGAASIVGAGFDFLSILRFQGDYTRLFIDGLPRTNGRIYVGGGIPLCLRACRDGDTDGINVSGRPATK